MSDDNHSNDGAGQGGDKGRAAAEKLIVAASQAASPHLTEVLARRALAAWPDCAAAFNLLAELADGPVNAADLFRQGIEAARRAVGPALFAELEGDFSSRRETRSYLRALEGLAGAMAQLGLTREALTLWREQLRLDRADRMGVREYVAVALLGLEEQDELERVLEELKDTQSALPSYCRALFAFRRGQADADQLLQQAIEHNRRAPAYLLERKPLQQSGPSYVSLGAESESEAAAIAGLLMNDWRRSEGALDWLAEQVRLAPPRRRSRAAAEEEVQLPDCYEGLPRLWGSRAKSAHLLDEALSERGLELRVRTRAARIWAHYASAQRPRIRNPGAPAAAVDYLLGKAFDLHGETRAQLAQRYGVSPQSVSSRALTIEAWLRASPLGPELAPEWFEDQAGNDASGGRVSMAKVIPFPQRER